jgi:alcohol dehydrogenase class IV
VPTRFEFATATRILFGLGVRRELPSIARSIGSRALVVGGQSSDRVDTAVDALAAAGVRSVRWSVRGEPSVEEIRAGTTLLRTAGSDMVIAVGGGSALDAGKALAALAANPGEALDYLEVIGRGFPLEKPSLPFIAVPTTAGSGAEVTRNAVLKSEPHRVKVSLRSALMLPRVALVDPELTLTLPAQATAATGLDALAQLIEPYLSSKASPLIDPLCLDGIARVARSLVPAFQDGSNLPARIDMSMASLFGGLALANAGLGAVHGFAGPIGGRFAAPHGAVCAALLPHVCRVNVAALQARDPTGPGLQRLRRVAQVLTRRGDAVPAHAVEYLEALQGQLGIPRLGAYGITMADVPALVGQSRQSSSMRGNPIELTEEELTRVLTAAI